MDTSCAEMRANERTAWPNSSQHLRPEGERGADSLFPDKEFRKKEEVIKLIKERCGWESKVSPHAVGVKPPTLEELIIIRLLDPKGLYPGR